ncbi:RIP metalloprotease RseP [Thiorhodovibrio frisius]|uniref:Zinc metalloprotease n=1 Tax=Thiorhodovibrio frisius TaxID=631362 RepID=H8Z809_9GAMM|nr:RIP metalloprotease RseP [Thiorhodovibrio frisius]EIC19944.1 RIP metalloprotease RseP [Thiorhodovibrio frisius]WPL20673.1 Regulator of sigma E protease [Thiorhodovibrio frisius]
MDLLLKLGAFLVVIAILITVHEFGHFWVARRLGVKVLRFSLGFGRPLLTWHRRGDETEYVLAAWPIGGYVKMVDEREEEVVDPADLPRAFNRQALWKRSAIVAAGPLANFLFAFLIYWLVLMAGESGVRPEVGEVLPESIAASAGFTPGDLIERVDQRDTRTWSAVWFALLQGAFGGEDVLVRVRDEAGAAQDRWLPSAELGGLDPARGFLTSVGLVGPRPVLPPVIGETVPGQPALEAGLQAGDRITAINGRAIRVWEDLVESVRAHPGQRLNFQIERAADTLLIPVVPAVITEGDERFGRIGAGPQVPDDLLENQQVVVRLGPLAAAGAAATRITDVSVLTLRLIGRMLTGRVSVENLSSPIGIADAAGRTAQVGFEPFVKFLALLSVSLGLLNLLPVPVLDGGHLLFFAVEAVIRRPLPDVVMEQGQRLGIALLVGLMTLAFYVDIARFLGL